MKSLYTVTDAFLKTKLGNASINIFHKTYEFLRYRISLQDHAASVEKLQKLFSDLTVRSGFMQGLKYSGFSSYGSSIFPKLSGTY